MCFLSFFRRFQSSKSEPSGISPVSIFVIWHYDKHEKLQKHLEKMWPCVSSALLKAQR